jgi:hypothetical protein
MEAGKVVKTAVVTYFFYIQLVVDKQLAGIANTYLINKT